MTSMHDPSEHNEQASGRARGGHERARRLTPEKRAEMARKAAEARWDRKVNEVICGSPDNPLRIGDVDLECYVLEDGTRVLTQSTFLEAIGRHRRPNLRRERDDELPSILQGKAINPFISDEVKAKSKPIVFRLPGGGRASGYNAELLPEVCEIYLKARDAEKLPPNQEHIAKQAEILMRGLAHVGIIALVDEATGYQAVRERNALTKILEAFIDKELRPWVKTFPPDFYREMFRLRGLEFNDGFQMPQYFGHLTNNVVYERLAPGVLDELKRVTPKDDKGRRKHRYHQKLTNDVGVSKLNRHLGSVVTLMRMSDDWDGFMRLLDRMHPRVGDTLQLPLDDGHRL
jgi:hypothetical protein